MKKVKTCQECEMEFTSKGVLLDMKKALIVTAGHGNDISVFAKQIE